MKTSILIGHHDNSLAHSTTELPAQGAHKHNTLQQIVSVAALSILLLAATFVVRNATITEVHTGHFLARVPH
jgi:hypothetical protein